MNLISFSTRFNRVCCIVLLFICSEGYSAIMEIRRNQATTEARATFALADGGTAVWKNESEGKAIGIDRSITTRSYHAINYRRLGEGDHPYATYNYAESVGWFSSSVKTLYLETETDTEQYGDEYYFDGYPELGAVVTNVDALAALSVEIVFRLLGGSAYFGYIYHGYEAESYIELHNLTLGTKQTVTSSLEILPGFDYRLSGSVIDLNGDDDEEGGFTLSIKGIDRVKYVPDTAGTLGLLLTSLALLFFKKHRVKG